MRIAEYSSTSRGRHSRILKFCDQATPEPCSIGREFVAWSKGVGMCVGRFLLGCATTESSPAENQEFISIPFLISHFSCANLSHPLTIFY